MADYDVLVQRYSRRYQDRLDYLDKLLAEADRRKGSGPEAEVAVADEELATLRQEREELLKDAEQLKKKTREEWQEETLEESGPMIMWEAVAKKLEGLIERVGRIRR
ncbi:MAG: hypothetical protein P8164_15520 [Gammaproteobacteria bacterium]|jgi:hypothetical protein